MNRLHMSKDSCLTFKKWSEINATLKKVRIVILVLQETHLDNTATQSIQDLFGKRMIILNLQLERNLRMLHQQEWLLC